MHQHTSFTSFNLLRNEREQFCEALHPECTLSPILQTAYKVRDLACLAYIGKRAPGNESCLASADKINIYPLQCIKDRALSSELTDFRKNVLR